MIKAITNFIARITNIFTVIVFVIIIIGLEIGFNVSLPTFTDLTGGTLLDMSVGYSADFAYERLQTFSKAADVYRRIRTIDFVFPAAYAFGLSILSCLVYRKKYDDIENYRWILVVPFLAAFFDYTENIILVILYNSLPAQYMTAASALNIITILKFGFLGFSVLLFITGSFSLLKGGDSMLLMGNKFKGKKKD